MNGERGVSPDATANSLEIVGVNYVSLYVKNLEKAVEFYSRVFYPPTYREKGGFGWDMGSTWLTVFSSRYGTMKGSDPCNTEFAIQVATPAAVDGLYGRFLEAGARKYCSPVDIEMYEHMRFACVDDLFGVRIDIYCPI